MNFLSQKEWLELFSKLKNPHILQTYEWGELKSKFGWKPFRFQFLGQPLQILMRKLPGNFSIGYLPKVNIDLENNLFWEQIDQFCKSRKAIFLKIEPDDIVKTSDKSVRLSSLTESKSVQPSRTIIIDLQGNEEDWLLRMKPKTRYNIRLAIKKDVKIEYCDDIDTFFKLMLETSDRDKFGVHSKAYYENAYKLFKKNNNVALLIAYYQDQPLAGLMVFRSGDRSWYFYGASNNKERNRMPTYLLQFEAMKWAKDQGCISYDLWGIPDEDEEILESEFDKRSDGLWGVYRFKRGFGGEIVKSAPALDRVYHPLLYKAIGFYQKIRGNML